MKFNFLLSSYIIQFNILNLFLKVKDPILYFDMKLVKTIDTTRLNSRVSNNYPKTKGTFTCSHFLWTWI